MKLNKLLAAAALLAVACSASAAVSPEEAKALGTTLTLFGAEKAGNKDGSIPAYTGGLTQAPADYNPKTGRRTNPFKDDKPLYRITSQNMDQYADKLSDGAKALLHRWPDFFIDVYPTHRSVSYPQGVLDQVVKNATTATMVDAGEGIQGARLAMPFPIPKSGMEAMWSYKLRYQAPFVEQRRLFSYMIDTSGSKIMVGETSVFYHNLYSDPNVTPGPWQRQYPAFQHGPPRGAGEMYLFWEPLNFSKLNLSTWVYLPGQRRVRLAPEFAYDYFPPVYGGTLMMDEQDGFAGRLDRFDWKLVGKKEVLIPYHNYDYSYQLPTSKTLGPKHPNAEYLRWELHRVWVVESTLRKDKRHILSKRNFYIDEDSWCIAMADGWDHADKLYRVDLQMINPAYDAQFSISNTAFLIDLNKGNYSALSVFAEAPGSGVLIHKSQDFMPFSTSDAMASYGVR